MSFKPIIASVIIVAACSGGACERAKSANPLSPDVAGPLPGVAITAPKTLEPVAGQQVVATNGPVRLLIENAGTNGPRALFLQVEVASEATFQQVLHQADRIEPGADGRTSYQLPEPLGAGHTYYWRARALDGANSGPYSSIAHFSVVDPVVIEAPTPLEPVGNISTNRPSFILRNGAVSGPAGPVVYRLEIGMSTSEPPAAIVTATPGAGGTTTMSLGDLPYDRTLFWRVYATDGVVDSPYSGVASFRTPAAPTSAPPPTPGPGPAPGGGGTPPLPGGSGGRAPDPAPGQRLPLPDMFQVAQAVAAARPDALRNSCQDHGGSWEFMDTLVRTLRTYDTRWGYNCKRGNCGDVSHDVVDYHWGRGNSEGSNEVYTIDVIGGHCGSNPGPVWINTQPDGGPGSSRWTCAGKC
jgi:hypothetical protein